MSETARRLAVDVRIMPMTDDPVRTMVHTSEGVLPFQRYFVERRCEPTVCSVSFSGAQQARPADEALTALQAPALEAVVICPSNPYLSVDPILAVPGLRRALANAA